MAERLITAWTADRKNGEVIQPHSHDHHELVCYLSGNADGSIGGVPYRTRAGSFALIPAEVPHDERHRADGSVLCIGFLTDRPVARLTADDRDGAVTSIARAILTESIEQRAGYADMLRARLLELLITLARADSDGRELKDLEYIAARLRENGHEKIAFPQLAEQLHLSYDYFRHRFRARFGLSPQKYLLRCRIETARRLLAEGPLSCTEIAYRCGFSGSSQFAMLFRRETGMTPTAFREACRAERQNG